MTNTTRERKNRHMRKTRTKFGKRKVSYPASHSIHTCGRVLQIQTEEKAKLQETITDWKGGKPNKF